MTSQQFPKVDSDGKFDVKIGFSLYVDSEVSSVEKIERWIIDQWLPVNQSWKRKWRNSQNGSIATSETVFFSDSFYKNPDVSYQHPNCLCIVLHGKDRSAPWRDWMVSKIVPELKKKFPQIGDRLFIENA